MLELRARLLSGGLLAACIVAAAVAPTLLGVLLVDLAWRSDHPWTWSYLLSGLEQSGRAGGIGPVVLATALLIGGALLFAAPLGLGTAVLLAGTADRARRAGRVRAVLDLLAATPSIVFGLFGAVFFGEFLGMGYSLLTGMLTLACMVLPLLVRVSEDALRAVPAEHRAAASALGCSRFGTLLHVLLPAAAPGLLLGFVLALGRAASETAALLFTAGYIARWPESLFDGGRTLSVHIYDLAMNVPGGEARAASAALVLLLMLGLITAGTHGLLQLWQRRRERRR